VKIIEKYFKGEKIVWKFELAILKVKLLFGLFPILL